MWQRSHDFAEGNHADRSKTNRKVAASFLARIHQVSVELGLACHRPMYPPMGALNYYSNRWWNWGTIQAYIREATPDEACEIEPAWILDRLTVSLEEITRSVQTLQQLDLPLLQVHGDFYRRNLIIFNGRIAALIDWDETRIDWRAWEIGRAVWEFCKTAQCELNLTAARDFIEAYRLHYSLTCWTLLRILILENITLPYWAIKIVSA